MADEAIAGSEETTVEPGTENTPETPESAAAAAEAEKTPEEKAAAAAEEKKNHDQRRADKFMAKQRKAEAEAAYWKGVAEGLQKKPGAEQVPESDKPKRADFQDDEAFMGALTDYKIAQKMPEIAKAGQLATRANQAQVQHNQRVAEAKKAHPDYEQVLEQAQENGMDFNPALVEDFNECILTSPVSAEMTYALMKDPVEFERLNTLSPRELTKELGKLEARIQAAQRPGAKPVSNAPAPIKPVSGRAVASKDLNSPDLSIDDWMKQRKAQLKKT